MTETIAIPVARYLSERFSGEYLIPLESLIPRIPDHRVVALSFSIETGENECALELRYEDAPVAGMRSSSKKTHDWLIELPDELKAFYPAQLSLKTRGRFCLQVIHAWYKIDGPKPATRQLRLPVHRTLQGALTLTSASTFKDFRSDKAAKVTHVSLRGRSDEPRNCLVALDGKFYVFHLAKTPETQTLALERPAAISSLAEVHVQAQKPVEIERLEFTLEASSVLPSREKLLLRSRDDLALASKLLSGSYDETEPLFFLHASRCGGTSLKGVLRDWFGDRYFEHYASSRESARTRIRLKSSFAIGGHFSREHGSAFEDLYPDARQKITILRDPFDIAVSRYHYLQDRQAAGSLRKELERSLSYRDDLYFNFLPRKVPDQSTAEYLKSEFLYAGLFDCLNESVRVLALLLGKEQPLLPTLNSSKQSKDEEPGLRAEFRRVFREEYELYDLVRENHLKAGFNLTRPPEVAVLRKQTRKVRPPDRVVL